MKYFYLLAFFILPSIVFAQSNYHEGYILKSNGDTVKGFINYREWERAPKNIEFKLNKNDNKPNTYAPENIQGFGVYGLERYVSFIGVVTMGGNIFPNIPTGLDSTKSLDTLFLKQAATGKYLTLYANKDDIKIRLFIEEPGAATAELIYYTYYSDAQQVATSSQFKGQLLLIANKIAPSNTRLFNEINKLTYDEANTTRLVDHINGVNIKRGIDSRLFLNAGLNITTTETNYSSTIAHSTSVAPKIGVGFDFFNNPQVQKFIFRVELSGSYAAPRFSSPVSILDKPAEQVYEYNQYTMAITPQILLNIYNTDAFKFYLDAGWAFKYSLYSNDKSTIRNAPADIIKEETYDKPYILEHYWSDFPLQAGVVLKKKIEIFASYTGYAAYTKYSVFYASNQAISLGVKLLMGK